jgi:hypothetical protein
MVALALATAQIGLCLTGVLLAQTGVAWVLVVGTAYVGAACSAIYMLESRIAVTTVASATGPIGVVTPLVRADTGVATADELAA